MGIPPNLTFLPFSHIVSPMEISVENYASLGHSWDNDTITGINLDKGDYKVIFTCSSNVFNICIDYVTIDPVS